MNHTMRAVAGARVDALRLRAGAPGDPQRAGVPRRGTALRARRAAPARRRARPREIGAPRGVRDTWRARLDRSDKAVLL